MMTEYTRREVKWLTPIVLGRFHDLIMRCDQTGFEGMLAEYPQIPEEVRNELIAEFKRVAAKQLSRKWRSPK